MKKILYKSIHSSKSTNDGIRICVMRKIRPEYDFDLWIPKLAPSEKLLELYVINKKISWKEFKKKYQKQILVKEKKLIKILNILLLNNSITLLCGEQSPNHCHRILIGKELIKIK